MSYDNHEVGIYQILNITNNKVYIGQSRRLSQRQYEHFYSPNMKSYIDSCIAQTPQNFCWSILEYCSLEQLDKRERYWIQAKQAFLPNKGYNLTMGGNSWRGSCHPRAKLTEYQVCQIQNMLLQKIPAKSIMKKIPQATYSDISAINYGRNWNNPSLRYPLYDKRTTLLTNDIIDIRQQFSQGVPADVIAEQYCLSPATVRNIGHGRTHASDPGVITPPKKALTKKPKERKEGYVERYKNIYLDKCVRNEAIDEILQKYKCSIRTYYRAMEWGAKNLKNEL